jgi:hypothetical protein
MAAGGVAVGVGGQDEDVVAAGAKMRPLVVARRGGEADRGLVETDRAIEVGDRELDRPQPRRRREWADGRV